MPALGKVSVPDKLHIDEPCVAETGGLSSTVAWNRIFERAAAKRQKRTGSLALYIY